MFNNNSFMQEFSASSTDENIKLLFDGAELIV